VRSCKILKSRFEKAGQISQKNAGKMADFLGCGMAVTKNQTASYATHSNSHRSRPTRRGTHNGRQGDKLESAFREARHYEVLIFRRHYLAVLPSRSLGHNFKRSHEC